MYIEIYKKVALLKGNFNLTYLIGCNSLKASFRL